jgi:hypothetical protein
MFPNGALPANFLNIPINKFVLFLVFKFSLEVVNSSITSFSATTKREATVFIAISKKRNFRRLRLSQSGTSNFALN